MPAAQTYRRQDKPGVTNSESGKPLKINLPRRLPVTTSAGLLAAGAIVAAAASPAEAAYYWPHRGDLCQAVENIQFYANDFSTPSYVVKTNEYIRIDIDGELLVNWTQGHGEGHSSRPFIYRHSDGRLRLKNCH